MSGLYLTITVCVTGVLLATVGISSANSVVQETEVKNKLTGIITSLAKTAQAQKTGSSKLLGSSADKLKGHIDEAYKAISGVIIEANVYYRPLTWDPYTEETSGVVQISYEKAGVICSGIHLKSWIVLTVADCVRGREPEKMYVTVKFNDKDTSTSVTAGVKDINIEPRYEEAKKERNLAVLIIYGQLDWNVNTFLLPKRYYTTALLTESGLTTYVNEWDTIDPFDYREFTVRLPVTKLFKLCGALGNLKEPWYCVDRRPFKHIYKAVDLGTPFFFVKNDKPYCLALYTGMKLRETDSGALYQSIYPSIDWIKDQVHQHPQPPE